MLIQGRPSASSQSVPPGHPSFRRQRASRACESECDPCLRIISPDSMYERGSIDVGGIYGLHDEPRHLGQPEETEPCDGRLLTTTQYSLPRKEGE
jgi:hypothetical protein